MRVLAFALALFTLAWAQDPKGPTPATLTSIAEVTPKTWASTATTQPARLPSYSAPSVIFTTITSDSVIYQVAVTPKATQMFTTVTSGGGVWQIPITPSSVATAAASPGESTTSHTHKTRTIVLSVIFSFVGAVLLIMAVMFAMRVRAQRRMRNRRTWAIRPGGWVNESKENYPMDLEFNTARTSFPEPQVPPPAPSHTRQRSL